MAVIEVEGLRKEFRRLRGGKSVAVDDLSFTVPDAGVFGFLGPNGSGKTTTIRCLLGLVSATKGRTRLLGAEPRALHRVMPRVGSIVESPALFPTFSGRRNLSLLAGIDRIPEARVAAVLDRVGLTERADDLVKHYSLGMKQRIGLAAALLKDPQVLILDEPANGLDPAGIKEVRELLRGLGGEGRAVFVSSHLLGEVQAVCDHVAILSRGRCIATGPVDEVLSAGRAAGMIVRVSVLPARAVNALHAEGFDAEALSDGSIRVEVAPEKAGAVTKALASKRIYLTELRPETVNLEDVFLELTEGPRAATPDAPAPEAAE
jgi:ABC-2 type transport system ATP-binding protein